MKAFFFIVCLYTHSLWAQDLSLYEKHYYDAPLLNMPYRYMRPSHQDASLKYPLFIFLHGANQRGFDNERQFARYDQE
jgi:predicted peptidase